jgi:hypothetical protein
LSPYCGIDSYLRTFRTRCLLCFTGDCSRAALETLTFNRRMRCLMFSRMLRANSVQALNCYDRGFVGPGYLLRKLWSRVRFLPRVLTMRGTFLTLRTPGSFDLILSRRHINISRKSLTKSRKMKKCKACYCNRLATASGMRS